MASRYDPFAASDRDEIRDLGFGPKVARDARLRLLNRDGTFNARRGGLPLFRSVPVYERLLTISWGRFYAVMLGSYIAVNFLFALAYIGLGAGAWTANGTGRPLAGADLVDALLFSVHTMTTLDYGPLAPASVGANVLVAAEALVGLAGFAIVTALLFARMARPTAEVRFSPRAVVAPYRGGLGFMFRLANAGRSEIVDASVRVTFSWLEGTRTRRRRRFENLELERRHVTFFPLHWTVVHPIGPGSPLHGWDEDRLREAHAEFLVQVAVTPETYFEVVRSRTSYVADEVLWGARFADILEEDENGKVRIDVRRIGEVSPAALPVEGPAPRPARSAVAPKGNVAARSEAGREPSRAKPRRGTGAEDPEAEPAYPGGRASTAAAATRPQPSA